MFYSISFLLHFYFFLFFLHLYFTNVQRSLICCLSKLFCIKTHYFSYCQSIAQFHSVSFFLLIFAHQYIFVVCFL
ncbi:expressed protein, partial [Phakopsora pachyrhizi]